jgi:hypothetical protein
MPTSPFPDASLLTLEDAGRGYAVRQNDATGEVLGVKLSRLHLAVR